MGRGAKKAGWGGRYVANQHWLGVFRTERKLPRIVSRGIVDAERDAMADYIPGAEWWLCRSEKTTKEIQRLFDEHEVACCLYERTGAFVQFGAEKEADGFYRIAVQLVRLGNGEDWDIDLTLSEIGVYIDEICEDFDAR